MLYDNALLARTYAKAADALDIPALTQVAFDTVQSCFETCGIRRADSLRVCPQRMKAVWKVVRTCPVKSAKKELTADEWKVVQMGWGLSGPGGFEPSPHGGAQPCDVGSCTPIDIVRAQLTSGQKALAPGQAYYHLATKNE